MHISPQQKNETYLSQSLCWSFWVDVIIVLFVFIFQYYKARWMLLCCLALLGASCSVELIHIIWGIQLCKLRFWGYMI
jgi:hypothetical protein